MDEDDVHSTQRHLVPTVAADLEVAGFEDAREIGRGGFGIVYRCVQSELDRVVAVKVLTADLSEENRNRFVREQQAMGRLTGHPHIVTIFQVGTTGNDRPFIVMEFLPSDSLAAILKKNGVFSLEEVLRMGVKLAGALATAHHLGVLHRDVKPGNVLITEYGEPALTDFGIARVAGGFETKAGFVTGSPAFTAPEVLKGGASSAASDLYGLGATLFSALTGHAAFERRNGEEVVAQFLRIATLPIPDLRERGVSTDMAAAIGRAMAADPKNRYASAAEFGNELRQIQRTHQLHVDDMALRLDQNQAQMTLDEVEVSAHRPLRGNGMPAQVTGLPKSNLPQELTEFIGRRSEISSVKEKLAASRLVTLTGIGGVGKTRLALRVAGNIQRAYSGGVWLVELGELHDGSLVPDVVAAAFNIRNHSERNLEDVLAEFIGSRDLLLVIDNCEQVVESVAKFADQLLRACANLRILATSREQLGIIGESVMRVPSLSSPNGDGESSVKRLMNYDAISLFSDRAVAAIPTFEISASNKDTVARICRRLDGLPLAIELAAARLQAMSVEQVLQRLTDRYALLTRGSRTAPTRQQTLSDCIDWSFDLCTDREQLMWERISIFAGSSELDAVEHVCGFDLTVDEVADIVSSLVEKSILIRESPGQAVRFRMLETLREYGRTKLHAAGEYFAQQKRHLDWCEQLVLSAKSEWISSSQIQWISRLEREQANLREALELSVTSNPDVGLSVAASLYHFWHARGHYGEGRHWLERLLKCRTDSLLDRITALYETSMLSDVQGDQAASAEAVRVARNLAADTSDPLARAITDLAEGSLWVVNGDSVRARPLIERAVTVLTRHDHLALRLAALHMLGIACEQLKDTDCALDCHEQVLAITRARGEYVYQSYSLWWTAFISWRRGDLLASIRIMEEALKLVRLVNNPSSAATCVELLAWIRADEAKNYRLAAVLMGAADELARSVGSTPVIFQGLRSRHHARCEETTRNALGTRQFEIALEEGQKLNVSAAVAYALGESTSQTPPTEDTNQKLTKRERQVAGLVSEGLTNKAIAARLVISPRTAQGHVENILVKLGFTSRTQIATWFVDHPT